MNRRINLLKREGKREEEDDNNLLIYINNYL